MPVVRGAQARSLPGSLETLAVLGGGRSGEKYENPIGWNGLLYILYITLHYSTLFSDLIIVASFARVYQTWAFSPSKTGIETCMNLNWIPQNDQITISMFDPQKCGSKPMILYRICGVAFIW